MVLGRRPLGVMQGRLLPKYLGRYQAHPVGYWEQEFPLAATFGLELIEFILDFDRADENPLVAPGGVEAIARAATHSGVQVRSICADYFMEAPLHAPRQDVAQGALAVLRQLLSPAAELGVKDVVIPCVDQSSLKTPAAEDRLVEVLQDVLPDAGAAGVNLCLETDLPPGDFAALLDRLPDRALTVNYDIGNSAALGYDPREEFAAYGDRISDLHVKDRVRGGGSTVLGTGQARIPLVFDLLARTAFTGPVIMQAFRDDEGLEIFRRQLGWLRAELAT